MTMLDVAPRIRAAAVVTRADAVVLDGRFLLEQRTGRAGVAELWCAQDVVLRRRVAVHLLPERAPVPGLAAAVQAAARVNDPRLAAVFDARYDLERPYLVSEWAGDPALDRLLPTAGLPGPELAARIVAEAAGALASAHAHGRPHLRLDLGSLHWGASGLKITGLGIDAALTGTTSPAPAAADTAALARILYALLTGYRPNAAGPDTAGPDAAGIDGVGIDGVGPDGVGTAWYEPRQLRPEVPPMLNAITCHALPAWGAPSISHPAQLAAALR
jgi:hypothetical protein